MRVKVSRIAKDEFGNEKAFICKVNGKKFPRLHSGWYFTNSKEKAISYALYEFLHLEDNKSRKDLFETVEDSDKLFK